MNQHRSIPSVVGVAVLGNHAMRLLFDDGAVRDIQYLPGHVHGSLVKALDDPDYFAQVQVDHEAGTVVWPNGLDLAPEVLHRDHQPADDLGFHDVSSARQTV